MRKFDFYEFTGILAPGIVLVYGIARLSPEVGLLAQLSGISFGEISLVLILAYVAGHLVQSLGNLVEWLWWKCRGGWPSDWVRTDKRKILASAQLKVLPQRIRDALRIECPDTLADLSSKDWKVISRQIYASVRHAGRAERIDIFNGNYGMFRGIAASLIVVLALALKDFRIQSWGLYAALLAATVLALVRMNRFGVHYSRELFVQFIGMRPEETAPKKAEEKEQGSE